MNLCAVYSWLTRARPVCADGAGGVAGTRVRVAPISEGAHRAVARGGAGVEPADPAAVPHRRECVDDVQVGRGPPDDAPLGPGFKEVVKPLVLGARDEATVITRVDINPCGSGLGAGASRGAASHLASSGRVDHGHA